MKRRDSEQSVIESVWAGGRNMDEQIESKCKCWLGRWSARGQAGSASGGGGCGWMASNDDCGL